MRAKALLEEALGHKRAGRKQQAESLCKEVLHSHPRHAQALHCLGELAFEAGQHQLALEFFTRALESAPNVANHCLSVGITLLQLGRNEQAVAALRKTVMLKPRFAEAQFRLGLALTYVGDLIGGFEALELAVGLKPRQFEIQRCFALVLKLRRERERAIAHYERALELNPDSFDCWLELANLHRDLKRFAAAQSAARRAVGLNPTSPAAQEELGWSLYYDDQIDESIESFRHALRLNPGFTPAYFALAVALQDLGSVREAITCYRHVLASDPAAHHLHSSINYLLPFAPEVSPADMLRDALEWDRNYAEPLRVKIQPPTNERTVDRRLRIGYVSHQFRDHCQARFLMPLLENHDSEAVEVFCYSSNPFSDEVTNQLRAKAHVWRDISQLAPAHAAALVRSDCIDILVDLTMHASSSSLPIFAEKPAPIQCCWLAYPGTTGLSAMDYRITDRYLDPPEHGPGFYSERSLVLPDSFWCYDPMTNEPDPGPLPAVLNGYITFGCLNHFRKLNDAVIELWAQVLDVVRGSRLILQAPMGQRRARIHQLFEKWGIPNSRVGFVGRLPRAEYLRLYQQIDIGLDTFPYAGHTTSLDAFWMGVPVVSLVWNTVVGRAGVTFASNLELAELANYSPSEFIASAANLASDLPRLEELRRSLRKRMQASPLMNGDRFARTIEAAYRQIWQLWCSETAPESTPARTPLAISSPMTVET
jgi:predicted O-linked N-acetylglucosamine transferase (SPINDLY family)